MDLHSYFEHAVAAAAQACLPWIGKGDKVSADQAAVQAMRQVLNTAPMAGRIVIGEGERDKAPMLHIGEELGTGGPAIDMAVDPLEGTTLCAENRPGALCVLAYAPRGDLLHAPDIYMQKLCVGPGLSLCPSDMDLPLDALIARLSAQRAPAPLRVLMLDRPRHRAWIDQVRATGADLDLISDGDVMGCLQTVLSLGEAPPAYDLYVGIGGAPEGVLAASGVPHLGGTFLGRLHASTPDEHLRAQRLNITDLDQIYSSHDLAAPTATLVISGVTAHVLDGVRDHHATVLCLGAQGLRQRQVNLTPLPA